MSIRLPVYPAYKDSSISWLGEIPAHWEMRRIKSLFSERVQKGFPDEPLLAATQTKGVVPKDHYESRTVTAQKYLHLLKLVKEGDFVISLRSFQGGIEYAHYRGIISPAYTILKSTSQNTAKRDYYEFFFKSQTFISSLTLFVTGIREGQNIDYERLSRAHLPVPPPDEQIAIGRFLRYILAKTSRLIRAKRRLIELLNEQKQAIIHKSVTQGLDPDVPKKDSGIDWLGDIPAHWGVTKLKRFARLRSGDAITAYEINEEGEYPVYGGNGLRGYTNRFNHDGDYALIGRQGALCGNINYAEGKFWASEHAVVAKSVQKYNLLWFGEMLRVMNLNQYSLAAAQPGLAVERIENLHAPAPSYTEQCAIVDYFQNQTSDIAEVIQRTQREIELIREYRTRLIADVVTGKLDVRGVEFPDLEEEVELIGEDEEIEEEEEVEEELVGEE